MMRDVAPLPVSALPIAALEGHLRLGVALEGTLEAEGVERAARAALAVVERRTGRALIARDVLWRIAMRRAVVLAPLVPVLEVRAIEVVRGTEREAAGGWYATDEAVVGLPCLHEGAVFEADCRVGLGTWDDVPADLREAVLLIGAALYEARGGAAPETPEAADLLIAPWRRLRLGGMA